MPGIKSFLYLDEYKMYSISSQIFEGMTESWVNIRGTSTEEEERQAGPFASGRVIIDPGRGLPRVLNLGKVSVHFLR